MDRSTLGTQLEIARDRVSVGPEVSRGVVARRWLGLSYAGGFAFMVVFAVLWATVWFWVWRLLDVNDDVWWIEYPQIVGLVLIVIPLAWGNRHAVGFCVDGSLVVGRIGGIRTGWLPYETASARVEVRYESDPPWGRQSRLTVGDQTWYLGPKHDPDVIQRWLADRTTLVATA